MCFSAYPSPPPPPPRSPTYLLHPSSLLPSPPTPLLSLQLTVPISLAPQITSVLRVEVLHLQGDLINLNISRANLVCTYSDSAGWSFNVITILIAIPILNYLVFPCLREFTPSMLKRIGIGYFFAILAPLMLIVIEVVAHHQHHHDPDSCMFLNNGTVGDGGEVRLSAWTVLPPTLAITLAEIFIFVSSRLYSM